MAVPFDTPRNAVESSLPLPVFLFRRLGLDSLGSVHPVSMYQTWGTDLREGTAGFSAPPGASAVHPSHKRRSSPRFPHVAGAGAIPPDDTLDSFGGDAVRIVHLISTRMKRRFPPSSLFAFNTAWAVVPEPANESRNSTSRLPATARMNDNSRVGFGVSKGSGRQTGSSVLFGLVGMAHVLILPQMVGRRPPTCSDRFFLRCHLSRSS
jgi:hypothetical protein